MISIIVCSQNKKIDPILSYNINDTIGNIDYEIVWIDNSSNQHSIFEAYNLGIEKSKGEYLCFMHEDILFHSNNWGGVIANIFKDKSIGMIGVVGGCYISQQSISWYSSYPYTKGKIYQGRTTNGTYQKKLEDFNNPSINHNLVKTIDGLFMIIDKSLFSNHKISFDCNTYKGFHLYDLDISMQINSCGYKIYVTNEILIEHKSPGYINIQYYDNLIKFHNKWANLLPQASIEQNALTKEFINDLAIRPFHEIFHLKNLIDNQNKLLKSLPYKILTKIIFELKRFKNILS